MPCQTISWLSALSLATNLPLHLPGALTISHILPTKAVFGGVSCTSTICNTFTKP